MTNVSRQEFQKRFDAILQRIDAQYAQTRRTFVATAIASVLSLAGINMGAFGAVIAAHDNGRDSAQMIARSERDIAATVSRSERETSAAIERSDQETRAAIARLEQQLLEFRTERPPRR